jgi:signal transduction histidine kinase
MLHEFISIYRDAIIARTRKRLAARPWPSASPAELDHGVPLFLSQLTATLEGEMGASRFSANAIGASDAHHGRDLRELGFSVAQVVHDYGDICQALTELALEHSAPITTEEFHTLNRCLDTAIAEAVTEHSRVTVEIAFADQVERWGGVAHEIRDMLNTANLAYELLKRGTVAINGSTGAVLGRTLINLGDFVESILSEIRLSAQLQRRERLSVASFVDEIAVSAQLHADNRGLEFIIEGGDPAWAVTADRQMLASAVMNVLNNAFKYTRAGGRVILRVHAADTRLVIEVEDECGGFPVPSMDVFQPFGQRRGKDRTGLGLGLSIARKTVRAHGGDIVTRNIPGKGCIFLVEVPLIVDGDASIVAEIVP